MAMDAFANEDCMIPFGLIQEMKVWEWIHSLENDFLHMQMDSFARISFSARK